MLTSPIAFRVSGGSLSDSSSTPAYSPVAASWDRKPPPVSTPATSIANPAPLGGWKPRSTSSVPRAGRGAPAGRSRSSSRPCGRTASAKPTPCTTASTGPMLPLMSSPARSAKPPPGAAPASSSSAWIVNAPSRMLSGTWTCGVDRPSMPNPVRLDHTTAGAASMVMSPEPVASCTRASASPIGITTRTPPGPPAGAGVADPVARVTRSSGSSPVPSSATRSRGSRTSTRAPCGVPTGYQGSGRLPATSTAAPSATSPPTNRVSPGNRPIASRSPTPAATVAVSVRESPRVMASLRLPFSRGRSTRPVGSAAVGASSGTAGSRSAPISYAAWRPRTTPRMKVTRRPSASRRTPAGTPGSTAGSSWTVGVTGPVDRPSSRSTPPRFARSRWWSNGAAGSPQR